MLASDFEKLRDVFAEANRVDIDQTLADENGREIGRLVFQILNQIVSPRIYLGLMRCSTDEEYRRNSLRILNCAQFYNRAQWVKNLGFAGLKLQFDRAVPTDSERISKRRKGLAHNAKLHLQKPSQLFNLNQYY